MKQHVSASKKQITELYDDITTSSEKVAAKLIQGFKEEIRMLQEGLKYHYIESPELEIEKIKWKIKIFEEKTFVPTPSGYSGQPSSPSSPRTDDFLPTWKDLQPRPMAPVRLII